MAVALCTGEVLGREAVVWTRLGIERRRRGSKGSNWHGVLREHVGARWATVGAGKTAWLMRVSARWIGSRRFVGGSRDYPAAAPRASIGKGGDDLEQRRRHRV